MTIEVEDLKKVKIEPDEYLLVKLSSDFGIDEVHRTFEAIKKILPKNTRILCYTNYIIEKLQVVKQL